MADTHSYYKRQSDLPSLAHTTLFKLIASDLRVSHLCISESRARPHSDRSRFARKMQGTRVVDSKEVGHCEFCSPPSSSEQVYLASKAASRL